MRRFFRSLFWLLLLAAAAYGYRTGVRPNDVKDYVSTWIAEWQSPDQNGTVPEVEDPTSQPPTRAKRRKKTLPKKDNQLQPLPRSPFAKVDRHARKCPSSKETSIPELAGYLAEKAKTDLEKARAIYVWLTENIRYDDEGYNGDLDGDYSAEGVLKNSIAVCEGFSNLYLALGQEMGLEIRKVVGYSKGFGYQQGDKFSKPDHAWNTIRINGKWRVFDATWGEGNAKSVNGKLKSVRQFDGYWFDLDPYAAAFNRLPEKSQLAHVNPGMKLAAFANMPSIAQRYFEIGFDPQKTYRDVRKQPKLKFPRAYPVETYVKMRKAPPYANLEVGQAHEFEFYIPRGVKAALIAPDGEWHYFSRDKGVFSLDFTPKLPGEYSFSIQAESQHVFSTLLVYQGSNPGRPS